MILQNVISMTSYFPSNKNVKFVLLWKQSFYYERILYYNKYIESYNVKEKSISLEFWDPFTSNITESIDRIEIESKATK